MEVPKYKAKSVYLQEYLCGNDSFGPNKYPITTEHLPTTRLRLYLEWACEELSREILHFKLTQPDYQTNAHAITAPYRIVDYKQPDKNITPIYHWNSSFPISHSEKEQQDLLADLDTIRYIENFIPQIPSYIEQLKFLGIDPYKYEAHLGDVLLEYPTTVSNISVVGFLEEIIFSLKDLSPIAKIHRALQNEVRHVVETMNLASVFG